MLDAKARLLQLNRPRLLVRAARLGADNYSRTRDLRRILNTSACPGPMQALTRLLDQEAEINHKRRAREADYSIARHVEVLVAHVAEASFFCEDLDRRSAGQFASQKEGGSHNSPRPAISPIA